jgi:O-antigen ligase
MLMEKIIKKIFFVLVFLTLTTPVWVFKDLLFPFVTSKAFVLRILVELALPLYIYLLVSRKEFRPNLRNALNIAIIAFVILNFISALLGFNPTKSLWGNFERMGGAYYVAHLALLYFYVLMISQINTGYLKKLLDGTIIIAVLVTLNGIFTKLGLVHFLVDPSLGASADGSRILDGRVSSTFGNPIFFGSFLVIPLFLSLFFFFREESRVKKLWYIATAILQLVGIFLSGTRGTVMGLIIGGFIAGVVYVILTPNNKLKIWGAAAIIVVVAGIGLLFGVRDKLPAGSMLQRVVKLNDSNTQARFIQWKIALTGFKEKPLLGVGPEAYYVISNKYFNPEIYKYDASWFDKPHNYILEILITGGVLGLAAYGGILLFALWSIYKAYKVGLLSVAELSVLVCALIVYEIQNLFVFDTVSASMIFFVFLGFCGFLGKEAVAIAKNQKIPDTVNFNPVFNVVVFSVSSVVAAYLLIVSNVIPIIASRNVNYGYAYGSVDPQKANDYFTKAFSSRFNFDQGESASKYQEFAANLVANKANLKDPSLAEKVLNSSFDQLHIALKEDKYSPIYWYKLATLHITKSFYFQLALNPEALDAAKTAVDLAPKRVEPKSILIQLKSFQGNFADAEELAESMVETKPFDLSLKLQLALVYKDSGKKDEAITILENLRKENFAFNTIEHFAWLVDTYEKQGKLVETIAWYEIAVKLKPNDVNLFVFLAKRYAQVGENQKALQLAQAISKYDPTKKSEMDTLISAINNPAVLSSSTTKPSTK